MHTVADISQSALEMAIDLDGETREICVKMGVSDRETYKRIYPTVLWLTDRMQMKALTSDSELVAYVSDVGLVIRADDLPRLPRVNERLESPQGELWIVVAANEKHGTYFVLLNQAKTNRIN
jgi:hypothetical protein